MNKILYFVIITLLIVLFTFEDEKKETSTSDVISNKVMPSLTIKPIKTDTVQNETVTKQKKIVIPKYNFIKVNNDQKEDVSKVLSSYQKYVNRLNKKTFSDRKSYYKYKHNLKSIQQGGVRSKLKTIKNQKESHYKKRYTLELNEIKGSIYKKRYANRISANNVRVETIGFLRDKQKFDQIYKKGE